jgi:squalene-associated FAD-dependent desaturase
VAQKLNVGIIGAGYAGMAAAVELAARGIPVTVFESARQPGGRARGVLQQDTQLDNGQHLLLGCYHDTLRLIEQVGGNIERDFLRLPLQLDLHNHLVLRAPRLPAPLHLLAALLRAEGLSSAERWQAVRFMLAMRLRHFHIAQDTTVSELLAQSGQTPALISKLWEPLCIAALNTPIAQASAQVLLNVLRDAFSRRRTDSDMLLPRIDFTQLFPQRAVEFVRQYHGKVHLACRVDALRHTPEGIALHAGENVHTFTHVICATSPTAAAKLLRPLPELATVVAQIDALQMQPIYTVYLQYPAQISLPHAMIGLHQGTSQWLFDKGKISGQPGLIASVISAEGAHQQLTHDELGMKVVAELREQFGILELPHWYQVIAEKRATFCCAPNIDRPGQLTPLPGLLLAGDYTAGDYPATLEGAVRSGITCTKALMPS